jgi:hypothetical protein
LADENLVRQAQKRRHGARIRRLDRENDKLAFEFITDYEGGSADVRRQEKAKEEV